MTDLPAGVRAALTGELLPRLLTSEREQTCDNNATRKMLWRLHDGALVESVLMKYTDRVTMCVSSQAGCGMGCPFCATGQAGLTRNLSTAEIVAPVVAGERSLQSSGGDAPPKPPPRMGGLPAPPFPPGVSPTSCSWAWGSRSPTTRT